MMNVVLFLYKNSFFLIIEVLYWEDGCISVILFSFVLVLRI